GLHGREERPQGRGRPAARGGGLLVGGLSRGSPGAPVGARPGRRASGREALPAPPPFGPPVRTRLPAPVLRDAHGVRQGAAVGAPPRPSSPRRRRTRRCLAS